MAYICTTCKKLIYPEDEPRIIEVDMEIMTHDGQNGTRMSGAGVCSLECLKKTLDEELARFTKIYGDGA